MEPGPQYVGIDLHRRRSVIVRRTAQGETLDTVRIDNGAVALAAELAKAGEHPEVVLEATYGWYWAADVLAECGATVHLAHPLGNNWGHRRVKNDERDATDLVDLLRLGRLAEAWIAPPGLRELRELIRYRAKLVHLRTSCKAQVHAVLAKEGVAVAMSDLFGAAGVVMLDDCDLGDAYAIRVKSLRGLIEVINAEIAMLQDLIDSALDGHPGFLAVQTIPGVGAVLAAVFVAEIGDVTRFPSARHLCSWAGMTPSHHESDVKVHRGRITKQAAAWSVGPPWKPSPTSAARHRSGPTTIVSPTAEGPTSAGSRRPANFSPWSSTAYATDTSAASPTTSRENRRRSPVRARGCHGPRITAA